MIFLRINDQILGEVQKRFKDNQVNHKSESKTNYNNMDRVINDKLI